MVREALQSISDAIAQIPAIRTGPKKKFTPALIRAAARRFCSRTSTGTDCWALKEFFLMPDPVLETLGELLADIQFDATPPLQVFSNIMATLPKKDGGVRTVAIAT